MRNLQDQGNAQFREGRYSTAIRIYETALTICKAHGFVENAVKLHSNAAAVYLKCDDFDAASAHAQQCIALDPDFAKVCTYSKFWNVMLSIRHILKIPSSGNDAPSRLDRPLTIYSATTVGQSSPFQQDTSGFHWWWSSEGFWLPVGCHCLPRLSLAVTSNNVCLLGLATYVRATWNEAGCMYVREGGCNQESVEVGFSLIIV